MVRKPSEQPIEYKCIRNGNGDTEIRKLLLGAEELYGKGRMFSVMTLVPGNSIGLHTHSGDNEIFYILSGSGLYNDNGTEVRLNSGDVAVCNDGEAHGFVNDTKEPLVFIAVILYNA